MPQSFSFTPQVMPDSTSNFEQNPFYNHTSGIQPTIGSPTLPLSHIAPEMSIPMHFSHIPPTGSNQGLDLLLDRLPSEDLGPQSQLGANSYLDMSWQFR